MVSKCHATFTVSNGCPTAIPSAPTTTNNNILFLHNQTITALCYIFCCSLKNRIFLPEMLPAKNSKRGMTFTVSNLQENHSVSKLIKIKPKDAALQLS